jgi:hypothetical protein
MVYMRNNYPTLPATYDDFLTDDSANTSYNGLNALPDGTIVVKSLYCPPTVLATQRRSTGGIWHRR